MTQIPTFAGADTLERPQMSMPPHAYVPLKNEAELPAPARKSARKMSFDERAALVISSLRAPSLTRFAHLHGLALSTLSTWRADARDGLIPVDEHTKQALMDQMPPRAFAHRNRTKATTVRLTGQDAIDAVLDSVRSTQDQEVIAAKHGISLTQLSQLRARARDGLMPIPMVDRTLLNRRNAPRRNLNKPKVAKSAATDVTLPIKMATPKAVASAVRALSTAKGATATEVTLDTDAIIVRTKGCIVEIPQTLDAVRMQAIVAAILAA